jgi:hypothetical protein
VKEYQETYRGEYPEAVLRDLVWMYRDVQVVAVPDWLRGLLCLESRAGVLRNRVLIRRDAVPDVFLVLPYLV